MNSQEEKKLEGAPEGTPSVALLKRRAAADAKYGPGSWREGEARRKPHRCNGHLEDFIVGTTTWPIDLVEPFSRFWNCMLSAKG